jgi:glycosyltransferase involved in cell wall biosynthesis
MMKRPDMPKVSVIIPTHNRADLLQSAISSVLNQTFNEFEIIVIDDHSTDSTSSVVAGFNDQRIKYIQNKGKNGPSVARNLGINNARGEYIAFLDDDDEWLPAKLEKQTGILDVSPKKVCGIYSRPLLIDKRTGKTFSENSGFPQLKGNLLSQLLIKNPIHTCTLVVRKKCLDQIGLFDETMRYMEDRDLWIRLAMRWDFQYIDEPLTKTYHHGLSHLSGNLEGQTQGREILLNRYQHLLKKNKKSWAKLHVGLGAQYCQLGKMKKGRRNLLKGMLIYPFNPIALFHFFSSLLGAGNYQRIRNYYNLNLK